MTTRRQWILAFVLLAVGLAGLITIALWSGSDWSTFVPDLIIGVIGAASIGLVLILVQQASDEKRSKAADVASAYNRLLDALTPLRTLDLANGDVTLTSHMRTRLVQLYEAVDDGRTTLAFSRWLNAEHQFCMFRAQEAFSNLAAMKKGAGFEEAFEASAPFHQWVGEFSQNIRFWRTGQLEEKDMNK